MAEVTIRDLPKSCCACRRSYCGRKSANRRAGRAIWLQGGPRMIVGSRPRHQGPTDAGDCPAPVVEVEPTAQETPVMRWIGSRDLTSAFRERHAFNPAEAAHPDRRFDLIHIPDAATGDRAG